MLTRGVFAKPAICVDVRGQVQKAEGESRQAGMTGVGLPSVRVLHTPLRSVVSLAGARL